MQNKMLKKSRNISNKIILAVAASASASSAFAEGPINDLFAAIDMTTVAASVLALGILIIGVKMAEKGIQLAKRNISKI